MKSCSPQPTPTIWYNANMFYKDGIQYKFHNSSTSKDVLNFFGLENGYLQTQLGHQKVINANPNYLPTSGTFHVVEQSSKFLFFKIAVLIISINFIIQIIYYSIKILK
ncbi:hypothetical protein DDB_G0290345 [Dictyostelium discoideum AX4]|uniref:Uncharacterized protein n=1 Tax=Dictyostelium discoideum TaxID=44689 RepID=Q54G68_DICDI|nr:hypothetical protein DDB_G0290345 [Dictyostelium discoideum AX4]EAL62299.1 hypothetical protein DDB_G0290345 [Dictyostelium discoideum AX4]|eukprot:XP_635815.1 hypothetical protein DDB_G0290345 [Dictyostelium discoideum AX4]